MPRFVVLYHDWPSPHYDLMLEVDGVLKTWRLTREPVGISPIPAEPIGDHRLGYLEYEGPVSGNRGTVTRWDRGELEAYEESKDNIDVVLRGDRLKGEHSFFPLNQKKWVFF
jgi:hypothetical protein